MSDEEESMIDFHEYKEDSSRLGCQISVTDEFDGMKVKDASIPTLGVILISIMIWFERTFFIQI